MADRKIRAGALGAALAMLALPALAAAAPAGSGSDAAARFEARMLDGSEGSCSAPSGQVAACTAVKYTYRCTDGDVVEGDLACSPGQSEDTCCADARLTAEQACEEKPDRPQMPGFTGTCTCTETY